MWRYRELMPLFDGEAPVTLGEGLHAADPRARARRDARPRSRSTSRTNRSTRPTRSRRAASRRRSRARSTSARRRIALPSAGNAGNAAAAYAAARRPRVRGVHPEGRQAAVRRRMPRSTAPNVTLVDGLITDAGRIAAETGRAARLVRRLDAEGAVPHRRQEDDGLRARRAAGLAVARLDRLSDRRRHRHGRHVEGVRRDRAHRLDAAGHGGRGWCRCRPRAARRSSARFEQGAEKARAVGGRVDDRRRPARAARDRRLPDPARGARERRHRARRVRPVDGRRDAGDRQHEGVSAAPEGGAALVAIQRLVADGTDQAARVGRAVQHRRRAEVSRRAA